MSSITQVGTTKVQANSNTNNPSVVLDSAPADRTMLAIFYVNENAGDVDITMPAGWTKIAEDGIANAIKVSAWMKIAGTGESTTVQGSLSSARPNALIATVWQGADPTNPLDVFTSLNGAGLFPATGSVAKTGDVPDREFAVLGNQYDETAYTSITNGYTAITNSSKNTGTSNTSFTYGFFTKDNSTPNTAAATMGATIGHSRNWGGIVFALQERVPVTYAKTGGIVAGGQLSGSKARAYGKTGSNIIAAGVIRGAKALNKIKTGSLKLEGAIKGIRPGFNVKTGAIKVDAIVSANGLHLFSATLTRDLTQRYFGIASGRVSTQGTGPRQGVSIPFTVLRSGTHTASIYTKATVPLRLRVTDESGNTISQTAPIDGIGDWQRFVLTTDAILIRNRVYRIYVETTQAVSTAFWIDGAQVESRKIVSEYVDVTRTEGQGPVGTALRRAKPAALIMDYIILEGQTFRQLRDNHQDFQEVVDVYAIFEDARDDLPILEA
jgi:hypothetical protein